jgi:hypothetical protein
MLKKILITLIISIVLVSCATTHFGYQFHDSPQNNASDFALIVHNSPDFVISIDSINDKKTKGSIRTVSYAPTYIEIPTGEYEIGVTLKGGYGPCGHISFANAAPFILTLKAAAGEVYLIQRYLKISSAKACSNTSESIDVSFNFIKLPSMPYEDVRPSFVPIYSLDLPKVSKD